MSVNCRRWLYGALLLVLGMGGLPAGAETDSEKAARLAGRYEQMVLRRPRLGPSLEKLIQLQGEAGQFEAWMAGLAARSESGAGEALLHGLVLYQQGNHKEALTALNRSLKAAPDQWYPQFLRGRLLLLAKDYEEAVDAFSAAVEHAEREEDLVEVLNELGRAQVRVDRLDDARQTWDRLIKINSDDDISLEELADTLADEGVYEEAVALIERLRDREGQSAYNQMRYRLRRATLLARMDQEDEAMAAWREVLTKVEESSWFHREALGRIEAQFQRTRNTAGLAAFYADFVKDKPDALGVRLAWARLLESTDKLDEAVTLLEETRERAPRNTEVQRMLAEMMVASDRFTDAVKLYEGLHRQDARDPEPPRALGELYAGRIPDDASAKAEALRWFGVMADVDETSTPYALQAAEALIRHGLAAEAVAFFDKAIARTPFALDTYRAKAELLLQLDRKPEALEAFAAMVAGQRRTVVNLMQQAEALAANDLFEEALTAARDAVALDPNAFDPVFFLLGRLRDAEDWSAVLERSAGLAERAPNDYFKDQVIDMEITALNRLGTLDEVYRKETAVEGHDADACLRLARMALVLDRPPAARKWVEQAMAETPTVYRMEVATRIYRKLGLPWAQIDLLERLMEQAPAMQTETARRLVNLYERVGEPQKAMEAARRVARSLPGNRDAVELLAQILRRQGRSDDAIVALERAARTNDDDLQLLSRLADLYRQQRQQEKAINAYWTLFQRTEDGQARLRFIKPLFELYREEQGNDALVQRLKEVTRSERDASLRPLALAYIWELDGRTDLARGELEKVLVLGEKDLRAMKRLVALAKVDGNLADAIRYQRDVVEAEPTAANTRALGDLYYENGEEKRAQDTWREVVERVVVTPQNDSARYFDWVNTLITKGLMDQAVAAVKDVEPRFRDDWPVTYRVGRAYAILDQPEEAARVFLRLMDWADDLTVDDGPAAAAPTPAVSGLFVSRSSMTQRKNYLPGLNWSFGSRDMPSGFGDVGKLEMIRNVVVQPGGRYGAYTSWRPRDVRELKVAGLMFLLRLSEAAPAAREWVDALAAPESTHPLRTELAFLEQDVAWFEEQVDKTKNDPKASVRPLWMALSLRLQTLQNNQSEEAIAAFESLVNLLEKRYSDEAMLMDVLRWQAVVYRKNVEGNEALVKRMMTHLTADDPALYTFLNQLISLGMRDEALGLVRTYAAAYNEAAAVTGDPTVLMRLNHLQSIAARQQEYGLLLEVVEVFFRHQLAVTRRIMDGDLLRPNFMQIASQGRYPGPNAWFDNSSVQVVRQIQGVARRAGEMEALMKRWEGALADAGAQRVQGASALALLAYWNNDKKGAAKWLDVAVEASDFDPELVRQLVGLQRQEGDSKAALTLLDRVKPGPGFSPKEYYQLRFNLALMADNEKAAKEAGLRLVHMTLNSSEMINLADRLRDWGLEGEAVRLEDRASRQATARLGRSGFSSGSGNLQQEVQLMEREYREGNKERALGMAMRLLDNGLDLENYEQTNYVRDRTVRLLNQAPGGMDAYILRGEERLAKSPQSITLLKRLAMAYHLAGKKELALAQADRLEKLRADDMRHRATMGILYSKLGEWTKGKAQFDEVLDRKPSLLFSNRNYLNSLRYVTQREKKGKELAEKLTEIGFTRLGNRAATLNPFGSQTGMVLNELMQFARATASESGDMPEVALALADLAEKGVGSSVQNAYRGQFDQIRLTALKKLGRSEEILKIYAANILDQETLDALGIEVKASAGAGNLRTVSRRSNQVVTALDEFVEAAEKSDLLERLLVELDRQDEGDELDAWGQVVRLMGRLQWVDGTNSVAQVARVRKDAATVQALEETPWKVDRTRNVIGRVTPDVGSAIFESIGRRLDEVGLAEEALPLLRKGFLERVAWQPYHRDTRSVEQILKLYDKVKRPKEAISFLTNDFLQVSGSDDVPLNYPKEQLERQRMDRLSFVVNKLVGMKAYEEAFLASQVVLQGTTVAENDHYMRRVRDALKAFSSHLAGVKKQDPERFKAFVETVRPWADKKLHPELMQWLARLLATSGDAGKSGDMTRALFEKAAGNLGAQLELIQALEKGGDKKAVAELYGRVLRENPDQLKRFGSVATGMVDCFFARDENLDGLSKVLKESAVLDTSLRKALNVGDKGGHLGAWMSLVEQGSRADRGGVAFGVSLLQQIPEAQRRSSAYTRLASRLSRLQQDWISREVSAAHPRRDVLGVSGLSDTWAKRLSVPFPGLLPGSIYTMTARDGVSIPVAAVWLQGEKEAGLTEKIALFAEAAEAQDLEAAWLLLVARIVSGDYEGITEEEIALCRITGKPAAPAPASSGGSSVSLTVNGQSIVSSGGSIQIRSGPGGVIQTQVVGFSSSGRSGRTDPAEDPTGLIAYVVRELVAHKKEVVVLPLLELLADRVPADKPVVAPDSLQQVSLRDWAAPRREAWIAHLEKAPEARTRDALLVQALMAHGKGREVLRSRPEIDDAWVALFRGLRFDDPENRLGQVLGPDMDQWPPLSPELKDTRPVVDALFARDAEVRARDLARVGPWLVSQMKRADLETAGNQTDPVFEILYPVIDHCADSGLILPEAARTALKQALVHAVEATPGQVYRQARLAAQLARVAPGEEGDALWAAWALPDVLARRIGVQSPRNASEWGLWGVGADPDDWRVELPVVRWLRGQDRETLARWRKAMDADGGSEDERIALGVLMDLMRGEASAAEAGLEQLARNVVISNAQTSQKDSRMHHQGYLFAAVVQEAILAREFGVHHESVQQLADELKKHRELSRWAGIVGQWREAGAAKKGSEARWRQVSQQLPYLGGHADRETRDERLVSWLDVIGETDLLRYATGGIPRRLHQSLSATHAPLDWGAVPARKAMRADGLRADWEGATFRPLLGEAGASGTKSNACAVAFAVSGKHLWVAWDLTDEDLVHPSGSSRWSTDQCDAVSLYLSPASKEESGGQIRGATSVQVDWVIPSGGGIRPLAACPVPGTQVGWKKNGSRIFTELAIPLVELERLTGHRGGAWQVESVWQDMSSASEKVWYSVTGRRADLHVPARATVRMGEEAN